MQRRKLGKEIGQKRREEAKRKGRKERGEKKQWMRKNGIIKRFNAVKPS